MLEHYRRGRIWWVRGYPADGNEYVRQSLGTSDEAIAQAAVRELEAAARKRRLLGSDAPDPKDELTFNECVGLYPAAPRDAGYLIAVVKKIGRMRVKDITPTFVRGLAAEMLPGRSTDTWQRQVVTPIRSVINHAHELGKCPPIRIRAFDKKARVKQDVARGRQSRVPRQPGSWPWLLAFMEHAKPRDAALGWIWGRHRLATPALTGMCHGT